MSDVIIIVPEESNTVVAVEAAADQVISGGTGGGGEFPLYLNIDGGDADEDLTATCGWDGGGADGVHTAIP